jgi:hypothetical protein
VQEIKTTIDVAASPERVWRVLSNFADYPRWNPFIRGIKAMTKLQPGAKLLVRVRIPTRGRAHTFSPAIVKAVPAGELCWRARFWVRGLFDGEHAFIIIPQGVQGCRLVHRERFSGLLAPLIFPLIQRNTRQAFEEMNLALKRVVEAHA